MKMRLLIFALFLSAASGKAAQSSEPLRVFIRAGVKTHGPGQHDHPRFLAEWTKLLTARGAQTAGALEFPSATQLEKTDVIVIFAADGMKIVGEDRTRFEAFLRRGGGLVVVHDGVVSGDQHEWAKKVQGGAWRWDGDKKTKWYEGEVGEYIVDTTHPITRGLSNFDWKDEIYFDLEMAPDAHVLATSFHSVFVIAPQLWTYEKTWEGGARPYRAFVSLPGHEYASFDKPHYRAMLLRGIAWAGNRDVNVLVSAAELASLKYPEGGPIAPEKAASKIQIHPEFDLRLTASEPLIEKPISLDWDASGRLWVAETPEYPNGRRINKNDNPIAVWRDLDPLQYSGETEQRPARDRIAVLEDTNGDGVMDKKTIFFDGLELVTSLVLYRDGVIVTQAPDIYWLRDTNNDGQADKKVVLYTGLGTGDTHAVISNMRWGMDGWIYATLGYSAGHATSADRTKDFGDLSSGVVRFKPDGTAFEQVSSKGGNTWGLDFAWDGELFFTQATSGDHLNHVVVPENVLARGRIGSTASFKAMQDHTRSFPLMSYARQAYVQIDVVGGFTAFAGSCLYTGGAWPAKYDGSHFAGEPTINIVHHDFISPTGVSYVASKGRPEEFMAGTDMWFRPIHTRIGPDGALYVIDFYNQAVVHNDTRGPKHGAGNAAVRPDRDHHFGRIWRVQHREAKVLEQPKLTRHKPAELVQALEHPNRFFRMLAQRLLTEMGDESVVPALNALAESNKPAFARVHALWTLASLGRLSPTLLGSALEDREVALRKNALLVVAENPRLMAPNLKNILLARLQDDNLRVRLDALVALGSLPPDPALANAVVAAYPNLQEAWSESAAVAVASKMPLLYVEAALAAKSAAGLKVLVESLCGQIGAKQEVASAARLALVLASAPATVDPLKQAALESLAATLKTESAPPWSADLQKAFKQLISSDSGNLAGAALPLAVRWDKKGSMSAELKPLVQQLALRLRDARLPDQQRAQVASSLLGVRQLDSGIVGSVAQLLGSSNSADLQRRVIDALGKTPDGSVGAHLAAAYPALSSELQAAAFTQIVKRSDWSLDLLREVQAGKISLTMLGPGAIHRLRTHSDKKVSERTVAIVEAIRGPEIKEKNELIARFGGAVEQPGRIENGRQLFTQNCATCHKLNGQGSDLAPDLTGMGAHTAGELLVHILDPNRMVEPNYVAFSIETKDGEIYDGIVARENRTSVVLRNAQGETELKRENMKSQRSTGLSLMPNGFEALGSDGLRDLMAHLRAGASKYRVLDLTSAFTANSTRGIYMNEESRNESLRFVRFGMVKAGDVPFEILSPTKSPTGKNLLVLRGGSGFSKTLPQRVEFKAGVAARQLHFLGGVAGWGWPSGGPRTENLPVVKVTIRYGDQSSEEWILKNGQEFADYNGQQEVPGSREVAGLVRAGQVRWFSKPVKSSTIIETIVLESYDNSVAPTFIAITAELVEEKVGSSVAQTGAASPTERAPAQPIRALIVGGGSSHNFRQWFGDADTATLRADRMAEVEYTENLESVLPALPGLDVLYLSHNQPTTNAALRKAIFDLADSGRGLLLAHAGLWYNWKDWPEYNRLLAGGGARSHDRFGEFEVTVTAPQHPIMSGVPEKFMIADELYHFEPDGEGTSIQVLATAFEVKSGKTYPMVWVVKHAKARIVGVALGHDGMAHDLPAFKTLLRNSLKWASRKTND